MIRCRGESFVGFYLETVIVGILAEIERERDREREERDTQRENE